MMHNIKARIAALAESVQRWKKTYDTPYEALDPISQALVDFAAELSALDEQGKQELLKDMNGAILEDVDRMIQSITIS